MDIYRYKLKDNKISLDVFDDVSKDNYDYYDADLCYGGYTICNHEDVDSGTPRTMNYESTSVYAQFYSTPQYLQVVKDKFIEDVLNDIKREKERYEQTVMSLSNRLIKMQEIEV